MTQHSGSARHGASRAGQAAQTGGFPTAGMSFCAPLINSIVPSVASGSPTPAYSRATTSYVQDHEAVQRQVLANEARFWGARRVRNLLSSSQNLLVGWGVTGPVVISSANVATYSGSVATLNLYTTAFASTAVGQTFVVSAVLSGIPGETVQMYSDTVGGVYEASSASIITLTATPTRYSLLFTCANTAHTQVSISLQRTAARSVTVMNMHSAQVEDVTGQSVQTPAEYVSVGVLSAPFQGANVDGVQYFDTTLAGVPIPATTLLGYLAEAAGTQLVTPTASIRLLSDAAWVKVGAPTITLTTGVDGVANSCNRVTTTAANTTILQTLVAAASSRTLSVYIKRISGTGNIELCQDGVTFTNINGSLITGQWVRVSLNASILNAVFGYRIVASGDVVEFDFNQFEAGAGATSPMATAGAARNGDALSYASAGNISGTVGSDYCEWRSSVIANNPSQPVATGPNYLLAVNGVDYNYDGTNFLNNAAGLLADTTYKHAGAWGPVGALKSIVRTGAALQSGAFDLDMNSTAISIGATTLGSTYIRNVRIYSQKLTDAQLTAMVA